MFVRFALSAELHFSSEIPAAATDAVDQAVHEANTSVFRRGVPKGTPDAEIGRITAWQVTGNTLLLEIESGPYTRAHDALFRFRKLIGPALGRFRVGLRDLVILTFTLTVPCEVPDTAIPRIPFIKGVVRDDAEASIALAVDA